MNDSFYIVPDSNSNRLVINPRIHEREIVVSPCAVEHWISTDLFKFRIYAERQQLHVVGICSTNQFPSYSLFCDEIVLVESKPSWYEDNATLNGVEAVRREGFVDIEAGDYRNEFMAVISDEEVISRFSCKTIYLLDSAYQKFLSVKDTLPSNVIVAEIKQTLVGPIYRKLETMVPLIGLDHGFQKGLVELVGVNNYMSVQILASNLLNWQFLCDGGSSNLMMTLPVKSLMLRDPTMTPSVEKVVRGFMKTRTEIDYLPFINNFRPNRVKPAFDLITDSWQLPVFTF